MTDVAESLDGQWQHMHKLLQQFHRREGHADVPQSHHEDGEALGSWLAEQQQLYRVCICIPTARPGFGTLLD